MESQPRGLPHAEEAVQEEDAAPLSSLQLALSSETSSRRRTQHHCHPCEMEVEEETAAPWLNPQLALSPVVEEEEDAALLLSEMPQLPPSVMEVEQEAALLLSEMMNWEELPELPPSVEDVVEVAVPMAFLSLSQPQTSLSLWTAMFEPVWRRSTLTMWQDLNAPSQTWEAATIQLRMFPLLMEFVGARGQICRLLQARLAWRSSCLPQAMAAPVSSSAPPRIVEAVMIALSTWSRLPPVDVWCEATPWRQWAP